MTAQEARSISINAQKNGNTCNVKKFTADVCQAAESGAMEYVKQLHPFSRIEIEYLKEFYGADFFIILYNEGGPAGVKLSWDCLNDNKEIEKLYRLASLEISRTKNSAHYLRIVKCIKRIAEDGGVQFACGLKSNNTITNILRKEGFAVENRVQYIVISW